MAYKPLEDYGIIGNLETCALVSRDGSIDWCCFPHLESPSIFASILDADRGGYFAVRPALPFESEQEYIDRTNVLRTHFQTDSGQVTVTDFMPVPTDGQPNHLPSRALYRRVSCISGTTELEVTVTPRFEYAQQLPRLKSTADGVVVHGSDDMAFLASSVPLQVVEHDIVATPTLTEGDESWFMLAYEDETPIQETDCQDRLDRTIDYWRDWAHHCTNLSDCVVGGPWHDLAVRSGLVLKLLTHRETGGIAAAPTTSLPEEIGGVRNWDYRYNWLRDAAFTVQALYKLGHASEANEYFSWLLSCVGQCHDDPSDLQPLYGLHGNPDLEERILEHLSGYRNSAPVRIGNAAKDQRQLDIYGELILGIYETALYGEHITADEWAVIRRIINYVCEIWDEPDHGIWEVRSEPQHFVYSKVMCWAALDRGLKIVDETEFEGATDRWQHCRSTIRSTVLEEGFSDTVDSFVRSFGTENLDATSLLIPIVGFLPFDDPRVQGTIDATFDRLTTETGLVYRYEGEDGLPGGEGTFVLCSFWLVDALALSGRLEEAKELFDTVCGYANPLGLLAEEINPETGEQLGNYPQAFSHIGLINSALYIRRIEGQEQVGTEPLGTEQAPED